MYQFDSRINNMLQRMIKDDDILRSVDFAELGLKDQYTRGRANFRWHEGINARQLLEADACETIQK